MEDFEGNVARTISRCHTHMNKICPSVSCDVYDVFIVLSLVTGGTTVSRLFECPSLSRHL